MSDLPPETGPAIDPAPSVGPRAAVGAVADPDVVAQPIVPAIAAAGAPTVAAPAAAAKHPRDPLHGLTLERIVTALAEHYGWAGLGERIPVRCFLSEPSVGSSLKFLRKTPWAREKVEGLYLYMQRDIARAQRLRAAPPTPLSTRPQADR